MLLAPGCLAPEDRPTGPSGDESGEDVAEAEQSLKKTPLCAAPGTLGYHLAQGTEKTPWVHEFNYNPTGELLTTVAGEYNRKTGQFFWTETYHPDHYRTAAAVAGSAEVNGTVAVLSYTVETTDIHDAVLAQEVEETWVGCSVTRRTRPVGAPYSEWRYHHGSYDGVAYVYDDQQAPLFWSEDPDDPAVPYANGTLVASDMAWIESFSGYWINEEFSYGHIRKGDANGQVLTAWARAGSGYSQSGKDELFLDGTVHRKFHMDGFGSGVDVQTMVDYDGNGSGTMEIIADDPGQDSLPVTCTLALTATSCIQTCPNQGAPTNCPWWVTQ
jgi:hypothetical protein